MLTQRNLVILIAAFLVGCAGLAPASSSDADRKLSGAIEQALPSLVSAGDYWTASKVFFQLAGARSRLKETRAACAALSQSLRNAGSPLNVRLRQARLIRSCSRIRAPAILKKP